MLIKLSFNKIKNFFKSKISKKRSNTDKTLVNENKQEKINDPWEENSWNYEENEGVYEENLEEDGGVINQIQLYKVCQFNIFLKYEEYIDYINEKHYDFYTYHLPVISFIAAHIKSYVKLVEYGRWFHYEKHDKKFLFIPDQRLKHYLEDFELAVPELVKFSLEKINVIYIYTLEDLCKYGKNLIKNEPNDY